MDRRDRAAAAEDPGSRRVLARRRRGLLWTFLALVVVGAVAVGTVVFLRSRRGPTDAEVASTVRAAVEAAVERGTSSTTPAVGGAADATAGVDTKALRSMLEASLDGWVVDLATDDARTRVGVAARRLDDPVCVFAWSDVGASTSAIVTDPNLPCVATVALAVAKPAA